MKVNSKLRMANLLIQKLSNRFSISKYVEQTMLYSDGNEVCVLVILTNDNTLEYEKEFLSELKNMIYPNPKTARVWGLGLPSKLLLA